MAGPPLSYEWFRRIAVFPLGAAQPLHALAIERDGSVLLGQGAGVYRFADGAWAAAVSALPAGWVFVTDLDVASDGTLYACYAFSDRIQRWTGTAWAEALRLPVTAGSPRGLAVEPDGDIHVVTGERLWVHDGSEWTAGAALHADLTDPRGLAFESDADLWTASGAHVWRYHGAGWDRVEGPGTGMPRSCAIGDDDAVWVLEDATRALWQRQRVFDLQPGRPAMGATAATDPVLDGDEVYSREWTEVWALPRTDAYQGLALDDEGRLLSADSGDRRIGIQTSSTAVTKVDGAAWSYPPGTSGPASLEWAGGRLWIAVSGKVYERVLLPFGAVRWDVLADFPPGARDPHGLAEGPDGSIWLLGSDSLHQYLGGGAWSDIHEPIDPADAYGLVVEDDGRVLISGNRTNEIYRYEPALGTWSTAMPLADGVNRGERGLHLDRAGTLYALARDADSRVVHRRLRRGAFEAAATLGAVTARANLAGPSLAAEAVLGAPAVERELNVAHPPLGRQPPVRMGAMTTRARLAGGAGFYDRVRLGALRVVRADLRASSLIGRVDLGAQAPWRSESWTMPVLSDFGTLTALPGSLRVLSGPVEHAGVRYAGVRWIAGADSTEFFAVADDAGRGVWSALVAGEEAIDIAASAHGLLWCTATGVARSRLDGTAFQDLARPLGMPEVHEVAWSPRGAPCAVVGAGGRRRALYVHTGGAWQHVLTARGAPAGFVVGHGWRVTARAGGQVVDLLPSGPGLVRGALPAGRYAGGELLGGRYRMVALPSRATLHSLELRTPGSPEGRVEAYARASLAAPTLFARATMGTMRARLDLLSGVRDPKYTGAWAQTSLIDLSSGAWGVGVASDYTVYIADGRRGAVEIVQFRDPAEDSDTRRWRYLPGAQPATPGDPPTRVDVRGLALDASDRMHVVLVSATGGAVWRHPGGAGDWAELYDVPTGETDPGGIVFDRDGALLLVGVQTGAVWRRTGARWVRHIEIPDAVALRPTGIAVEHDGEYLLAQRGGRDRFVRWDAAAARWRPVFTFPQYTVGPDIFRVRRMLGVAVTPDGELLAWGAERFTLYTRTSILLRDRVALRGPRIIDEVLAAPTFTTPRIAMGAPDVTRELLAAPPLGRQPAVAMGAPDVDRELNVAHPPLGRQAVVTAGVRQASVALELRAGETVVARLRVTLAIATARGADGNRWRLRLVRGGNRARVIVRPTFNPPTIFWAAPSPTLLLDWVAALTASGAAAVERLDSGPAFPPLHRTGMADRLGDLTSPPRSFQVDFSGGASLGAVATLAHPPLGRQPAVALGAMTIVAAHVGPTFGGMAVLGRPRVDTELSLVHPPLGRQPPVSLGAPRVERELNLAHPPLGRQPAVVAGALRVDRAVLTHPPLGRQPAVGMGAPTVRARLRAPTFFARAALPRMRVRRERLAAGPLRARVRMGALGVERELGLVAPSLGRQRVTLGALRVARESSAGLVALRAAVRLGEMRITAELAEGSVRFVPGGRAGVSDALLRIQRAMVARFADFAAGHQGVRATFESRGIPLPESLPEPRLYDEVPSGSAAFFRLGEATVDYETGSGQATWVISQDVEAHIDPVRGRVAALAMGDVLERAFEPHVYPAPGTREPEPWVTRMNLVLADTDGTPSATPVVVTDITPGDARIGYSEAGLTYQVAITYQIVAQPLAA